VALRGRYADTVRVATLIALAFCTGAAMLVWIRPRLGRASWLSLAAVFVVVDVGLMGLTSQLSQVPPNDLLAGTTPIQKLMVAKLPAHRREFYSWKSAAPLMVKREIAASATPHFSRIF